jgi:hypothetical protein
MMLIVFLRLNAFTFTLPSPSFWGRKVYLNMHMRGALFTLYSNRHWNFKSYGADKHTVTGLQKHYHHTSEHSCVSLYLRHQNKKNVYVFGT